MYKREEYDKILDLEEDLGDAYSSAFDMVMTEFDGILAEFEHKNNLLEEYIDQAEELGYMANEGYYEALRDLEQKNLSTLQSQRDELSKSLENAVNAGAIKKGSEAWNDMQSEINDVTEAIQESQSAIIEYNNEIREIQWDRFDYLHDSISRLTDEADFLIDLMGNEVLFDDKGFATDKGGAVFGLHGQNYNTYMEQALSYAKAIEQIESEMVKNPYDTALIERRNELLDQQYDMILAAEGEKDAIVDLVEEGINIHLDALQELIDKYKDALNAQKDLYDYQNNVQEQTEEISSLEKQLAAWQGDTSEEGRTRLQQTQAELEEARKNLEETQYDKYISDQEELLDNLFTQYSDILNERLDNVDQLIIDVINKINENASSINTTLQTEAANVGYVLSDNMNTLWNTESADARGIKEILTTYMGNFPAFYGNFTAYTTMMGSALTNLQAVLGNVNTNIANLIAQSDKKAQEDAKAVSSTPNKTATSSSSSTSSSNKKTSSSEKTTSSKTSSSKSKTKQGNGKVEVGDQVTFVSGRYYEDSYGNGNSGYMYRGKKVYVTKINSKGPYPYHISRGKKLGSGDLGWLKKSQIKGYKRGGKITSDQFAWTQEGGTPEVIVRPSDGAVFTFLKEGDNVLNGKATQNLVNLANNPQETILDNLRKTSVPNVSPSQASNVENKINFNIELPNVQNANDFISELQRNDKFQRMIQDMTVGRLGNKSPLAKLKYKF